MKRGAITVFISSAAVMLVELIAGRLVAPYFGQSTRTWAALTAVTLAGCTIGNAIIRAPASSYAIDNSAIASAGNMPFNQRHHYRAPASSYAIDNTSNAIDYEQERQHPATPTTPS